MQISPARIRPKAPIFARVIGSGTLREVVVWPGVEITAPRRRGIVVDDETFLAVPDLAVPEIEAIR